MHDRKIRKRIKSRLKTLEKNVFVSATPHNILRNVNAQSVHRAEKHLIM